MKSAFHPELLALREAFRKADRDVRVVGGYVRDLAAGGVPKDVDLHTDATPDEVTRLASSLGRRTVPTGISHGTVTVILPVTGPHEITTLRAETEHDGRHAKVTFTRDWTADLARRDLTVNAMSLGLDGDLLDPFDGRRDLSEGRVRFVGDAETRMREDYLRILRWLRFHGRFGRGPLDAATCVAATATADGLSGISRERVWSEMSRIVTGPDGPALVAAMTRLGLAGPSGLPDGDVAKIKTYLDAGGRNPAVAMSAWLGHDEGRVEALAASWRWSGEQTETALFVARRHRSPFDPKRLVALEKHPRERVAELALALVRADLAEDVLRSDVPRFPVTGGDLAKMGFEPGPSMGETLRDLREAWAESGYASGRDELLERLVATGPEP